MKQSLNKGCRGLTQYAHIIFCMSLFRLQLYHCRGVNSDLWSVNLSESMTSEHDSSYGYRSSNVAHLSGWKNADCLSRNTKPRFRDGILNGVRALETELSLQRYRSACIKEPLSVWISSAALLTLKRAVSSSGLKTWGKLLNSSCAEKKGEEQTRRSFDNFCLSITLPSLWRRKELQTLSKSRWAMMRKSLQALYSITLELNLVLWLFYKPQAICVSFSFYH